MSWGKASEGAFAREYLTYLGGLHFELFSRFFCVLWLESLGSVREGRRLV